MTGEAHLTQVFNGIARCTAPSGLKKALSLEAVRLAPQERVQQQPLPERKFGEQNELPCKGLELNAFIEASKTPIQDQNLQRAVEQIIVDFMDEAMPQILENMFEQKGADARNCSVQWSRTLSR